MRLDEGEVRAAYYGLSECVRQTNLGGRALPPGVGRLFSRLEDRLSRGRHETSDRATDQPPSEGETWIGSPEAARMLSWSKRQVQRHALDMGGKLIGGRWMFRESDVADYAERNGDGYPS